MICLIMTQFARTIATEEKGNVHASLPTYITVVGLAIFAALACQQSPSPADIEELKRVFTQPEASSFYGGAPSPLDPVTQAMDTLAEMGTPESLEVFEELLIAPEGNQNFKQYALVVLGRLGTKPAIEMIEKFEAWAERRRKEPWSFAFRDIDSASNNHDRARLKPLRTANDEQGTEWAVFIWAPLAKIDLWITSRNGDGDWSRPVLLDIILDQLSEEVDFSLEETEDKTRFLLTVDGQSHRFGLEEKVRDRDGDGLTDLYEYRIGTDSLHPDCDVDGTLDGIDGNPLTRPSKGHDDKMEIRQAVFSVMFATGNGRGPILMIQNESSTNQEYKGYLGPVVRTLVRRIAGVNIGGFGITQISPAEVAVGIMESVGEHNTATYRFELKKKTRQVGRDEICHDGTKLAESSVR